MKIFSATLILSSAILLSSCGSSKPTLDRNVLEGFNDCVKAEKEAEAARQKAWYEANKGTISAKLGHVPSAGIVSSNSDCKDKYGIPYNNEITDYRIIN